MPKPPGRWSVLAVAGVVVMTAAGAGAAVVSGGRAGATPTASGDPAGSPISLPLGAASGGPAALVDPEAGTGIGAAAPGNVSEYPGASVPLGMVQFSPDTSPDRQVTTGSGYDYADSDISGFSLTHLSGPGCAIYGDIPILPVSGPIPADPDTAVQPFSHADEQASAGNYAVRLGPASGDQDIGVQLTATTRSALGAFTFPASSPAGGSATTGSDGLLFKVSDSADGSTASRVQVVGNDELVGSVTSGDFCGIPGNYTLYFAAQFSRPFATSGTWQNGTVGPSGSCAGTATSTCGAWVSFLQAPPVGEPADHGQGGHLLRLGGGRGRQPGRRGPRVELPEGLPARPRRSGTGCWTGWPSRAARATAQRTFYTALYHSLLFPSVFSDDDGHYVGFDHRVHTLAPGHVQYANFSEVRHLPVRGPTAGHVAARARPRRWSSRCSTTPPRPRAGFLPRWAIADNDAGQWDGDSADPIIADAYAYGARQFNVEEALKAMVHGATVPENGLRDRAAEPASSTRLRAGCPHSPTTSPRTPTPTEDRRPSSTRSTTSRSPNWPRRSATARRPRPSPSVVRTGRTSSIRHRVPGRPPGRRELPGRAGLPTGQPGRPGPGGGPAGIRGGQRHPVHLGRPTEPGRAVRADGRGQGGGDQARRRSSPSSMPPGSPPTTGPGTSPASGSPSSTTTPATRRAPSRWCAAS